MWLDRKPDFQHHIKTKAAADMRAFMGIAKRASTEKGLSLPAVRHLYISCVTAMGDYGAEVWLKGQQSEIQLLVRILNQAVRKIQDASKTTPITPLEAE